MAERLAPGSGWLRGLRTTTVTVAAAGLAVGAHLFGDGCMSPQGVLLAVALCLVPAWALTARERGAAVVLGALVLTQVGVHLTLAAFCEPAAAAAPALQVRATGWHLLAAGLTAVLLRAGDAALWTAVRVRRAAEHLRRAASHLLALRRPPAAPPVVAAGARGVVHAGPVVPPRSWRGPSPVRRGPPPGACAS